MTERPMERLMVSKLKSRDILALASSIILIIVTLILWAGDLNYTREITKEDGIVENLSALFYLLSFVFCTYCLVFKSKKGYRKFLFLWAVLSLVFLGEETSWFQRFLDIPTPEYIRDVNDQGELNIHNLNWFVSKDGLFRAMREGDNILGAFLNSNNLFRMGFFTYFFIIPILVYSKKFPIIEYKLNYPTPSLVLFISIWTTILLALILFLFSSGVSRVVVLAETREMTFAAFIFIYTFTHLDYGARRS